MAAVVMFWSAAIALIFFLLGVAFKGLVAAFNALLTSMGEIFTIGALSGAAIFILYVLRWILNIIIAGQFGDMFGEIILDIILIGIAIAIFACLGDASVGIFVLLPGYVLTAVSFVLEGAARICDKIYYHSIRVIVNQLEKC